MSYEVDYFDKLQLLKIIWRKLKKIAQEKWITLEEWSNRGAWLWKWDISNVMNWKKWVSTEKLIQIAWAIWVSKKQLEKIIVEAKKDELRIFYWVDVDQTYWNLSEREYSYEELLDMMKEKENLSDEQTRVLSDLIKTMKK